MKRNTAILVAIASICGVGVAILEFGPQRVKQQQLQQAQQLLTVAADDVTGVELQDGEESISLTKDDSGHWQLLQPVNAPAEDLVVQSLITTLTSADAPAIASDSSSATTGETPDLTPFGLAEPQQTIVLSYADNTSAIKIGDLTFDSAGQYLQVDEGPIRVLDVSLVPQLSPGLFALRDKTLVDWSPEDLQSLKIATPDDTVELEKDEDAWQLSDRPDVLLSDEEIADTLSQAQYLQASQFVSETKDTLADYGLESPDLVLEATLIDGSTQIISVGEPVPDDPSSRYAISSERTPIVAVAASNLNTIATSELELRDRSLGRLSSALIGEIAIAASDSSLNFTLSPSTSPDAGPDEWEIADQPDRLISIESFLIPLSDVRADGFLPADDPTASPLLETPSVTLQMSPTEGIANQPLTLEFAPGEEELYVRTSHIPDEILVLDLQFYDLLEAAIGTFKPAA